MLLACYWFNLNSDERNEDGTGFPWNGCRITYYWVYDHPNTGNKWKAFMFFDFKSKNKKHFLTSLLQHHRWMWSPSHQTRIDGRWKIMGSKVLNRKKPHGSVFFLNVYKRSSKPLNSARDGAKIWRSDPLSISHNTMDLCFCGRPARVCVGSSSENCGAVIQWRSEWKWFARTICSPYFKNLLGMGPFQSSKMMKWKARSFWRVWVWQSWNTSAMTAWKVKSS